MTAGPDQGALSGLVTGVSFLAGMAGAMVLARSPFPMPGASGEDLRTYFRGSARAARVNVSRQLVSTVALARFTVSVARLARRSGPGSTALTTTAVGGGALAVASLATAAVTAAQLTGPHDDDRTVALARRVFVSGGPVHCVGFGLLTGVLGLAGLRTGELPRPVAASALAAATSGVASPLYFVWERAGWLIPGGRFPGLVASGIAGARLARTIT